MCSSCRLLLFNFLTDIGVQDQGIFSTIKCNFIYIIHLCEVNNTILVHTVNSHASICLFEPISCKVFSYEELLSVTAKQKSVGLTS